MGTTGGNPGGGFTVDPAQLQRVAGRLTAAYDDFQKVRTDFGGEVCFAPDAFGDFGMADAYAGFDTAWTRELSVTSDAIAELIRKVTVTADDYSATESSIAGSFKRSTQ